MLQSADLRLPSRVGNLRFATLPRAHVDPRTPAEAKYAHGARHFTLVTAKRAENHASVQ